MPSRTQRSNPLESVIDAVKAKVGGGGTKAKRATKKTTKKKTAAKKRK